MKRNLFVCSVGLILMLALMWSPSSLGQNTSIKSKLGSEAVNVVFCSVDGTDLLMDVYYPEILLDPAPVVMFVHGGGWRSGDKSAVSRFTALQELRERGYLVVSVNYRLAPQAQYPAMIEDVKCAVRHLRANALNYGIDPTRIGAWGGSAGGHLVSLLGVTGGVESLEGNGGFGAQSSNVQAVVDMFGPIDLSLMYSNANANLMKSVFNANSAADAVLTQASPITWVSDDDAPVLILHGDKDQTVPLTHSEIFLDRLLETKVTAELVVVENGGHGFIPIGGPISPSFARIGQIIVDFFDTHLR